MMNAKALLGWVALALAASACGPSATAQVEQVWLTHRSHDPSKIVVNWITKSPTESVVRFGATKDLGSEERVAGARTLHHVEIPIVEKGKTYHYSVGTVTGSFKSCPTDNFRIAVVANWHNKVDLSAIVKDDVHLLTTAGDNISSLWQRCGSGKKDCYQPYAELVATYSDLFRSTPFMPVLGNHDREIRPRGDKPPQEPVYDIEATAFREFFQLPDDEWKWHFDVPDFGLRLVALDFNHISDLGTTWQTCHDFSRESDQFRWYQQQMEKPLPFVVTLFNERNASIRNQAQGAWHELFRRGTACITGFGHFAERAEVDGLYYFNTSLTGKGAKYADPKSRAFISENNYVLLTLSRANRTMTVDLKSLEGKLLDRTEIQGK